MNKPLPFRGGAAKYPVTPVNALTDPKNLASLLPKGKRLITTAGKLVAKAIEILSNSPFKNIVIDDMNYISQDYYMKNALKGGWDVPKQIGYTMGLIFDAINLVPEDKNVIVMAHYEEYKDKNGDSISYKYKTTGKMTDDYITPEGKFEIVLYGKQGFDENQKKSIRQFVTNFDGEYPAKSPVGMFSDLYILNDLGLVVDSVQSYYSGE